jgi:hypothetical protein
LIIRMIFVRSTGVHLCLAQETCLYIYNVQAKRFCFSIIIFW